MVADELILVRIVLRPTPLVVSEVLWPVLIVLMTERMFDGGHYRHEIVAPRAVN